MYLRNNDKLIKSNEINSNLIFYSEITKKYQRITYRLYLYNRQNHMLNVSLKHIRRIYLINLIRT